jgi:hypothetical protein
MIGQRFTVADELVWFIKAAFTASGFPCKELSCESGSTIASLTFFSGKRAELWSFAKRQVGSTVGKVGRFTGFYDQFEFVDDIGRAGRLRVNQQGQGPAEMSARSPIPASRSRMP